MIDTENTLTVQDLLEAVANSAVDTSMPIGHMLNCSEGCSKVSAIKVLVMADGTKILAFETDSNDGTLFWDENPIQQIDLP